MAFVDIFGNIIKDENAVKKIQGKNLLNQINKFDDAKLAAYKQGLTGLGENPTAEALAAYNTSQGLTSLDLNEMAKNPWKNGNAGTLLSGWASAHPLKTAAGIGLGAMNVGGLTDNDYYGGQIAGLLAGGLGSRFLGNSFSPMATMAGGALGSLFDKLRQKQADSRRTY